MTPYIHFHPPGSSTSLAPLPPLTPDPGVEALMARSSIYLYSVDYRTGRFRYVSPGITRLLGYDVRTWQFGGPERAFQQIHPEDQDCVQRICTEIQEELHQHTIAERSVLNFVFTCRVRHAAGHYLHLNHRLSFPQLDANGIPETDFTVVTDVSGLRAPHNCQLHVLQVRNGKTETLRTRIFTCTQGINFSQRELEVLELVAQGRNSQEIGKQLFISYNTVCSHRKSLMKKAGVKSTVDLLRFARGLGVVR